METRTIQISGMGVVSAAGTGLAETLDNFAHLRIRAGRVTIFDTALTCPVFEVPGIPENPGEPEMRTLRLCRIALRQALTEAGFTAPVNGTRMGVCLGTTVACQLNDLQFYETYRRTKAAPMEPVDRYLKGNLATAVARSLGVVGPCATVANACSSSADAIGVALSWLDAGLCDIAVAGGADELNRIPLCGFNSLGIVSPEICKPFDAGRKGLNLGEAAGILILETREHAAKRSSTSRVSLMGYGLACDAYHLTAPRPDGDGLEAAIRIALSQAGIPPSEIAFVNAHGTATPDNDKVEGNVLARVFGPEIKFLSTKGMTGHTLGAAGAIEAIFTAAGLREQWIPASAGFQTRDNAIPISPVTRTTAISGRYAMSTSLAFGGNNAAVVIGLATD